MYGTVVGRQAEVKVVLKIPDYPDLEIGCVIDTGFEGALTMPTAAVAKLQLPYVARINVNLANDENLVAAVHRATIVWDGEEIDVPVLAIGRRPRVGTLLLATSNLNIDFLDGGTVAIERCSQF